MDQYITGSFIRRLRESRGLTQSQLADRLCVSDKAVSKWETGKGYPDITLIEPLAGVLGISVAELLSGADITNRNRSFQMLRTKWYVCPVCGNVIHAAGEAAISCHGILLPPLEAEPENDEHRLNVEVSDGEYYVTLDHEMTKAHAISFLAAVTDNGVQLLKLYPEGSAEGRFPINRTRLLLFYCNRHGLFAHRIVRTRV